MILQSFDCFKFSVSEPCPPQSQVVSLLACLDKLHLALLQSLVFSACVNLSPGLLSAGDLAHITHTLTVVCPLQADGSDSESREEESAAVTIALERLAQILQVASGTRTYISDRGKSYTE